MKSQDAVCNSTTNALPELALSIERAMQNACARIAPTWPLDRFIAVNPFWGMINRPMPEVGAKLQALSGARLLMPRAWYRREYEQGRLRDEHILAAIEKSQASASFVEVRALLYEAEPTLPTRLRLLDVVDAARDTIHEPSWRTFVAHSVSQFCAAHFDEGQASLGSARESGLYSSWRSHAATDRSPSLLMGLDVFRNLAKQLPATAQQLISSALAALQVPKAEYENYLFSLLLDQNGWASWCAYRRWTARLAGHDDDAIAELLAIRLAWEWILLQASGVSILARWRHAITNWQQVDAFAEVSRQHDWLLQLALEIAWCESVVQALPAGFRAAVPSQPMVQAAFCIDVRSEVFRRAFEAASSSVQTLGFAGFFGLPIAYRPSGALSARPQLPGLLAPRLRVTDSGVGPADEKQRVQRLEHTAQHAALKMDALSTFVFVEALGITYAGKLVADTFCWGAHRDLDVAGLSHSAGARRKPRLEAPETGEGADALARTDLAASILRGMSLTQHFARIVLLVGHGSMTTNNPHAAGLDCGACCGQTGEVNARAAAALLNDPATRRGLATRDIVIPDSTWFMAGLHNTTTDDVVLFDLDELPDSHQMDLQELKASLAKASVLARAERAQRLGLDASDSKRLERALRHRTKDWSQVRAEWGLANNAAFIIAPRERTRHLNLRGRAFLHEYRRELDPDHKILELLMTAPMVVAHWINLQYYASTVDNERYGSGNKVLHNVVGGHMGVFEGNGGDLRIGLPLQSLHDGEHWVHTPLRLSVFIEAPRPAIDNVLAKHESVRALVKNGWLHLLQLDTDEEAIYSCCASEWRREPRDGQVALKLLASQCDA